MMVKVCLMVTLLCVFLLVSVQAYSNEITLAVLDFENNSFFNPEEYNPLTKGLAEIMITELNQVEALSVVERKELRSLLDELKLSQSGIISEKSSIQVGKILGAQHLVFGSYMVTMDKKVRIDVRIVKVETGLTVKAGSVTGKTKNFFSLIRKLSKKILKDLNVRLSKKEEQSFEKSQKLDIKAVVLFSRGVDLEDDGRWEEAIEYYKKAIQMEPKFQQAQIRIQRLTEKVKSS